MTREEMLKAKKARVEKEQYKGKVWKVDETQDCTLSEYCEFINPDIKEDEVLSIHVVSKTCKEKTDKKGNPKTFLKVVIETPTNYAELPLSFNGEDRHFKAGDEIDIDTFVLRTEVCGNESNDYFFGELL